MTYHHISHLLFAALLLGLLGARQAFAAPPPTVVYGTTANSNAGASFTPGTIASGSTVRFDDGTALANNSTITVNGTLQFNQSTGTFTINNTIAGNGNLALINSGTVQLTGTSAGRVLPLNMTINATSGRLMGVVSSGNETTIFQLGSTGTGTLNVAGGVVSGSSWQVGVGSTGVGTVNVTGGTFAPSAALTVGGSSGGSGGTGTLTINGGVVGDFTNQTPMNVEGFRFGVGQNSSGVATITNGTLGASATGNGGSFIGQAGTGNVTLNSGYLQAGHLTLGSATTGNGSLNIVSGSASTNNLIIGASGSGALKITGGVMKSGIGLLGNATSGTGTVSVTSGTWLVNGNGLGGESFGVLRVGGTSGGTGNLTIGNGGYVVVSGSFIRGANGTFSLNEGGTLQIGGKSGVYTPSTASGTASAVDSGTMGVLVGDLSYAGTLKFAQNNNSGTMASSTYSGNLSGSGDLVKTGTGTITLSGSNSYTGGTIVTGGKLALGSANAIGTTGNITFNGGSLQATANNTQDYSSRFSTAAGQQYSVDSNGQDLTLAANLTSANGSFTKLGSGNITLTGANSFTTGSAAAGVLIGNATTLAASGNFGVASGAEVRFSQTAPNQTWAGAMAGSGTFTKLGAGTLTLTGSGADTNGTLVISDGAVKGSTNNIRRNVVNNSQLTFDQTTSGTYSRNITGTGNVLLSNSGTVTWTGTSTYTGTTTVAGGRLIGTTSNIPGDVVNNSAVQFTQGTNGTYSGNMSGSGLLTKTGVGTVTLTGSNSYEGGTFVNAGSLIGTTSSLQGAITNNAAVTFDQASDGTYSGAMSGTGSLTKSGAGAVTFSGNSTHTGATTISAGQLVVGGALSNSTATVQSGATIGGSGRIGGLILASGATLAPGNSPGTLAVNGNATWNGGANYNWQVAAANTDPSIQTAKGSSWDFLDVGGSLTLGLSSSNKFNINLWSLSSTGPDVNGTIAGWDPSVGSTWLIATAAGGISLNGSALTQNTTYTSLFNINTSATNGTGGWLGSLPVSFEILTLGDSNSLYLQALANAITTSTRYWLGSEGDSWTAANNWSSNATGTPTGNFTASSDIIFSADNSSNETATNLGGDQTIASLTINTTGPVGISGGNLTINGTSATALTVNATAGNVTISAPLILSGSSSTLSIENANTTLASITSANGLVKTGNGTVEIQNRIWVSELGGDLEVQSGNFVSRDGLSLGVGASNETATISGNTTAFSSPTTLNVGYSGNGNTLAIENGAIASAASVWIGGTSPSENNSVTVNGTGSSLTSSAGGSIAVGYAGANNTLTVSNGGTANSSTAYIGYESTANNNTAIVTGANSTWSTMGALMIGYNGTGNTLSVANGGNVTTTTQDAHIGFNAGSNNNALSVDGSGSRFTTGGGNKTFYVGNKGAGNTLTVLGGGNLTTYSTRIGSDAASSNNTATISGNGSIWNNANTLRVGSAGSGNTLAILNGGGVGVGGNAFLGYSAGSNNNLLTVNGNGSTLVGSELVVGRLGASNTLSVVNAGNATLSGNLAIGFDSASSNNTATVTGAGSTLSALNIQIGTGANNKLIISDSGLISTVNIALAGTNATLQIGDGGAAGNLSLTGSILTTGTASGRSVIFNHTDSAYQFASGMSGNLAVKQNGNGTTILTANATHTGGTVISAGTLSIGNGGTSGSITGDITNNATLVFNRSDDTTFAGSVSGNGSVEKLGNGTLSLTGSTTNAGGTTISAGTLSIGNGGTTGSITGNITNNATLAFNRSNDSTYSGYITGTGNFTKLGTGVLSLSGNNTYTGGTTVTAGTLAITGSVNGTSSVAVNGGSSLTITGTLTATGAVAVNTGTITIGQGGALAATGNTTTPQTFKALLASNRSNYTIAVLNMEDSNSFVTSFGQGNVNIPTGISFGPNGNIYAASNGANSISIFAPDGTYTGNITGNLNQPHGLAFDSTGNLYVANYGSNSTSIFAPNGTYTGNITANLHRPTDVVFDSEGKLYISNDGSNSISVFAPNGTYTGNITGNLNRPYSMALGSNGSLYVVNNNNSSVSIFSLAGNLTGNITSNLTNPFGSVVNSDGKLYVANHSNSNKSISTFEPNGAYSGNITLGFVPYGLAIGNFTMQASVPAGLTLAASASDNATLNLGAFGGNDTTATLTAPFIAFGNGTAALNLNLASNFTLSANLTGGGANSTVNQLGTGTTTISSANNNYAGTVNINSGTLAVTGSLANATTRVNSGGTLGGNGTLGAVTVNGGGTIAPGNSPGTITVGNLTLNAGAIYNWQTSSNGTSGTAGTDWDLISSLGALTLNATSGSPITINLSSLGNATLAGVKKTSWEIGNFTTGITGFDRSAFTFNSTSMTGNAGSYFMSLGAGNLTLVLNYKTGAVWNTASGNWSTASQWEGNSLPENGDSIEFSGPGGVSLNNGYLTSVSGITFTSSTNGSYTVGGSDLAIDSEGIINDSNSTQTVALNLALGANQTFAANTANLVVSGNISGNASLTKAGNHTLVLAGTNSYTGPTVVEKGALVLAKRDSLYNGNNASWTAANISVGLPLGTSGGNTTFAGLAGGAALVLKAGGAGEFTADDIGLLGNNLVNGTVSGNIATGFGAFGTLGIDTTGGNITMAQGLASGNTLSVNGSNYTQTYSLLKLGSGTLDLAGNNTFSFGGGTGFSPDFLSGEGDSISTTVVNAGTLRVGSGATLATPLSFVGGNPGDGATLQIDGGTFVSFLSTVGLNPLELSSLSLASNSTPTFTGQGVMNVTGGNVMSLFAITVGGANGQLNISGGNVTAGMEIPGSQIPTLGLVAGLLPGTNGTINVSGGNVTAAIIALGGPPMTPSDNGNFGGNGTLNITGGNVTAGNVYLGSSNASLGVVNVSGGNLLVAGGSQPDKRSLQSSSQFIVGGEGTGLLSVNGTGKVIVAGTLSKGNLGTIALESGGTLQIGYEGTDGTLATDLTNNGTLVFDVAEEYTHLNAIAGAGVVNKAGLGTLVLTGSSNTYSGTTWVNAGTLQLDSSYSNTASAITVNATGTLAGSGSAVGDVIVLANGTISPNAYNPAGRGANNPDIGTLTVGNLTLNGRGIYDWQLGSAKGEAGADWDLISATGGISINATSGEKFTINATALQGSNFDPNARISTWKIAESATQITGFAGEKFNILTNGFGNNLIGAFFTSLSGNKTLNLNYATMATWNAGTGNWTTTSNWEDDFAPIDGVAVEYAGPLGTNGTSTNNDTNLANISGLTFTSGANGSFAIAGGELEIGAGGIVNNSTLTQTIGLNITLGADQTFAANTANLVVSGNISGNASLTKAGNQTLTLSGASSYTGETTIAAGTLAVASSGSLTGTSKIFVGNTTSSNTLSILGSVSAGNVTLSHQVGSNDNTVTVGSGSSPASLTVANLLSVGFGGTGNNLDILGNGSVTAASTEIGGYGANNTLNLTGGVLNSTGYLVVGYFADDNTLNITAGGNATVGSLTAGLDAGSANNTILVSGTGSALHTAGLIYLGESGTSNSLAIQNGGKVVSQNADAVIGFNAGSNGNALSINGSVSQFTNNGTLYVGKGGSENTLAIDNRGSLVTRNTRIGGDATSSNNTATVSGNGSVWTNTGTLSVGYNGTGNTLTLSDHGAVNITADTYLGYGVSSANNLLTINGTGSSFASGNLLVGQYGSSNTLRVENGGNVTLAGALAVGYDASSSNNTVEVSGTSSTLSAQNIQIGSGADNKLTVADSGLVSSANIALAGTNATLQIGNGGAAGDLSLTGSILTLDDAVGRAVVFNHTDSAYQFASGMNGDLAVSQIGNGTTILTANTTYTGGTNVSSGTLSIGNGGTSGSIEGDVINNGTLVFNRADDLTFSGTIVGKNAAASLNKVSLNTLTLTGNNTFRGTTTISAGTLQLGNGGDSGWVSRDIVNNATLAINRSDDLTFANVLTGNGSILKLGNNTLTYNSTTTPQGGTTVNAGTLLVTGTTSSVTVNSAGTLAGTGTTGDVTITSGGTIAPGNSPGTITVGNLTLTGGAIYNWQTLSLNGTGIAGTDWDLINSTSGSLSINASANSTVGIRVSTLDGNFTNDIKKAQWQIGNFTEIIGYNKSYFSVNASGTGARGRFFVTTDNSSLMLNYKTAAVWIGGNGSWTTTNLWEDAYPPDNGDAVEFSGSGGTSTNNSSLTSIAGITFTSSATGSYTLNGNALNIGEEGIVNDSTYEHTIALNLTAGKVLGVNTAASSLTLSGVVSGATELSKTGFETLTLSGNNTYAGGTTITAGTLALGGTAGAITGNITVDSGATFAVNRTNNTTISNLISGNGSFAQVGSGVTSIVTNNTYLGGTNVQNGTLWAKSARALGNGTVTLGQHFDNRTIQPFNDILPAAGGTLLVSSSQEMDGNLKVGNDFYWNNGKIAYYDTGSSPLSGDLTIHVAGNFTLNTIGNATFDFSGVEALDSGNYTLVNATTVFADNSKFTAVHGPYTTLFGNFTTSNNTVLYTVTGAVSGGSDIQNNGGPNTPVVANYNITGPTVTIGENNKVNALTFSSSAPLAIQSNGELTVTSGTLAVETGSSVVSGGTLNTPGNFDKTGAGELDLDNTTNVTGIANVVEGLMSVNGQLNANSVVVDPNATLGGAGLIVASNVVVNGNLSPGNSPGTLSVAGNLLLTGANSTLIEIASPTNFDRIIVSGQITLGGKLNAVGYGGYTIAPGSRFDFLQAGSIVGTYDSLIAPDGLRVRFLSSGTVGTLLFGPGSYVPMAINQNQRNVAKALDTFIVATDGDRLAVSIALDSLTTEQFPSAFDQIMPGFYESLANIAIEQAFAQTQMLNQRISSVRLGAAGFQAIGGISQPLLHDKNGKSAADAKDASPIVESATATNWNSWALGTGMFSRSTNLPNLQNYNNDAGGFVVGTDYRWSENFVTGLYAGYDYSYAEYNGGGSTKGNSVNFGTYASYAKDGYYADAVIGGGYTGFQTKRSIQFSTIDRTASADPNSGQFTAGINLGKDFEVGKFTLGPIVGAQYTYAGIGSFTESGAESLDLSLGQQNANSLRSTLGGRIAYTWNLNQKIALIPEVRMFWQHEFLNNARNINASLDGGNGAAFDFETTDPYRNSVFAGAGVTAQFGERWNASLFYNVNFGSQTYQSNMISAGLNFSF